MKFLLSTANEDRVGEMGNNPAKNRERCHCRQWVNGLTRTTW
jgi:hypothetical protein